MVKENWNYFYIKNRRFIYRFETNSHPVEWNVKSQEWVHPVKSVCKSSLVRNRMTLEVSFRIYFEESLLRLKFAEILWTCCHWLQPRWYLENFKWKSRLKQNSLYILALKCKVVKSLKWNLLNNSSDFMLINKTNYVDHTIWLLNLSQHSKRCFWRFSLIYIKTTSL